MHLHPSRPSRLRRLALLAGVGLLAGLTSVVGAGPAHALTGHSAVEKPSAFSVVTFDGTTITGDYFAAPGASATHREPTVLYGPGWGGAAFDHARMATSTANGTIGVAPLLAAGYNVVSWNPRGFNTSTGVAEADSSAYEGRDVSEIITWVAAQPWALLDGPGDPRIGMVGGSYGGEVQWAAAAVDPRIDAIVPDISWNSLESSLDPHDTAKTAWSALLAEGAAAAGQRNAPIINRSFADAQRSFQLPAASQQFFSNPGRDDLAAEDHAPALIIQGTVDTLFPLEQSASNYLDLVRHHVPVKMLWFCGGHGVCLTNPGDTALIQQDTLTWLDRYLRHHPVNTGPGFTWVDQNGTEHNARTYSIDSASGGVSAIGSGTMSLNAKGGSGPYTGPGASKLGPLVDVIATPASNAVDVPISFATKTKILGAPTLSITYSGDARQATARILAQIVDNSTGVVLGSQITPIPVTLDGHRHEITLPLEYLAAVATPGSGFTLQIVADSSQFNTHPTGGRITFSHICITLPTGASTTG